MEVAYVSNLLNEITVERKGSVSHIWWIEQEQRTPSGSTVGVFDFAAHVVYSSLEALQLISFGWVSPTSTTSLHFMDDFVYPV